ncbi:MAG: group 1 truncated hemoglobin [Fimbriimonadaceae bacterium]
MELSLYDKLGATAGIQAIVEALYARLLKDPELAAHFAGENVEAEKRRQRLALCELFGGPPLAEPRPVGLANGLSDAHYDRLLAHLGVTLVGLNIQIHLAAEIETLLLSLRMAKQTKAKQEAA